MLKLLARIFLFILFLVLMLEISAFVFNKFFRGITYSNSYLEKRSVYKSAALFKTEDDGVLPDLNWIEPEIHPYFGYTESKNQNGANNHGFKTNYNYPYKKKNNEFVVGIFGGSVALQLTYNSTSINILENRLGKIINRDGQNRKVVILPFAIGGWKQPQTFFAYTYYFDNLDMVIVLDGYNDIIEFKSYNKNWTLRYPPRKIYENLIRRNIPVDELAIIGQIVTLRNINLKWTNIFAGNIAGKSMFLHTIWHVVSNMLNNKINSLQKYLYDTYFNQSKVQVNTYDTDDQIRDYFQLYERLSTWQSRLADTENIHYFHFLQPNQYIRNSKPFTETEITLYLRMGSGMTEYITNNYYILEDIFTKMNDSGVHAYSLTKIFINTNDTVYADDCCHLNSLGLSIIANKMIDEIEKSGLKNVE